MSVDPQTSRSWMAKIGALFDARRPVRRATMGWIALATILADQASKWWAFSFLLAAGEPRAGLFWHPAWWADARLYPTAPMVFLPNFFELRYQTNTGAAFSMLEGHTAWLAVFSAVISVGLIVWGWRLPRHEWGLRLPFGLILGGAVGNLIDRVRLGQVIDFILAHWHQYYWPTFNLADSAVCIGMAWLVVTSFRSPPQPQEAKTAPAGDRPAQPGQPRVGPRETNMGSSTTTMTNTSTGRNHPSSQVMRD